MSDTTARAREQFNCTKCAGSGRIMVGNLASGCCATCEGSGTRRLTINEIMSFVEAELLAGQSAAPVEEVARAIAEKNCEHFADFCRAEYVERFTEEIIEQLRQHGYGAQGQGVSDRMQGVDCPLCEDSEPHKHVAPSKPKAERIKQLLSEWAVLAKEIGVQQLFGETIESDLAQGQGVGPMCPKCQSLKINRVYAFDGVRSVRSAASSMKDIADFCICRSCNFNGSVKQFFSPVPPPESATKEGK